MALVTVTVAQGCRASGWNRSGPYRTVGLCDGLPKLDVETPQGVCVGMAASGFRFPRGIAERRPGEFFVADMGRLAFEVLDEGSVWALTRNPDGSYSRKRLLSGLDRPSGIRVGPEGRYVYVGTPGGIIRFLPEDTAADGLPRAQVVLETHAPPVARHPLTHFVFDPLDPSTLYVNLGSVSDVCEANGNANPCPEAEGDEARGVIRKYRLGQDGVAMSSTIVARGLRNSVALAAHPRSGLLVQGENARDDIDKANPALNSDEVPHDELNVIDLEVSRHYGWPYCYDNNVSNPEYAAVDCAPFTRPVLLLPPRSGPLGMAYYTGRMFPEPYQGALLLGYHGYRTHGHRLVMVPVDPRGVPAGDPLDVIRGWDRKPQSGDPQGAPVDVIVASDGSLYVTEDKNGDVLRVVYERERGDGLPLSPLPTPSAAPTSERSRQNR